MEPQILLPFKWQCKITCTEVLGFI